jgi:hypothetical protein
VAIHIQGPSDLMHKKQFNKGLTLVFLNTMRKLTHTHEWDTYQAFIDDPRGLDELTNSAPYAIAILKDEYNSDFESMIMALFPAMGVFVLDIIGIDTAAEQYFSYMCSDGECCPRVLPSIPNPKEIASAIEISLNQGSWPQNIEDTLEDIQVRDWLLVLASKAGDSLWKEIVRLTANQPLLTAQGQTLAGVAAAALGDYETAVQKATFALEIDPYYNLATLLLRTVELNMPPSVLVGSFRDTEVKMQAILDLTH